MKQELIEKYKDDCLRLILIDGEFEVKQMIGDETNPIHLLWMLEQIEHNTDQSETKKHRWLGYIQGVLVCKKVFTVVEERDYTRDFLNGE